MKKKLQVFVSSTFTDLIVERQAAVSAILKLGHIPAGMELFTANDKSQWETIKRWIDESDVYMLILGGRYGSVEEESGISYTEKEFNYALQVKKPLFSVVIKEEALENNIKEFGTKVMEKDHQNELTAFRKRVLSNMSSFYEDVKDIKLCIMESLPQISSENMLSGWVSGRDVTDVKNLVDEIGILSNDNAHLKKQLANELENKGKERSDKESEFSEMANVFKKITLDIPVGNTTLIEQFDLYGVFIYLAPQLIVGIRERLVRTEHDKYIYSNVCPRLFMYGLVENETENVGLVEGYNIFKLTKVGQEFAKYCDKINVLENS